MGQRLFTTEWTVAVTQDDIDAGSVVVLAGWLSTDTLADPEAYATVGVLNIGGDMDESMDEGADESMDEGAEESMDEGADESMDESMDEGAEESMDDAADEMPVTGAETGLLLIVGVGVLIAGLLLVGAGRRVSAVTR